MMIHLLIWALLTYGYATPRTFTPAPHAYSATAVFTLPTGSALNDFWTIQGSATTTVYMTGLEKQCSIASAPTNWTNVMVRRASETGGSFTAWTAVPHDINSPPATAVVGDYHNGLTTGNSGGTVFLQRYVDRILVNSFATGSDDIRDSWGKGFDRQTHTGQLYGVFPFLETPHGFRQGSPLILRGTSDILGLTTSFAPANAITCRFTVEWYEIANTAP